MKIAFYSTKPYDRESFEKNNGHNHEMVFLEARLDAMSVEFAKGFDVVCCFVNDKLDKAVLTRLKELNVKLVALRCAGYNNVNLKAAKELELPVVRVPNYSPYAVAEHAVALILTLNRKTHRAYARVRENNFSLHGLLGFDLHGKTVGIVGTGRIGAIFAKIMQGFGCKLLAFDPVENPDCKNLPNFSYVDLQKLFAESDIVSLHCPLTPDTKHMISEKEIAMMKNGVMLINTSRGKLIDTAALIEGLKIGHLGYVGLDVYEEEEKIFFENLSDQIIQDDQLARLQSFPNVLITSHQAFFTEEALTNIATTTFDNIDSFVEGKLLNQVK